MLRINKAKAAGDMLQLEGDKTMKRKPRLICPSMLAARWEAWGGETQWSRAMMDFAEAGGMVEDWGGVPRSFSAIPLTFCLWLHGIELPDQAFRRGDITRAVKIAREMGRAECSG